MQPLAITAIVAASSTASGTSSHSDMVSLPEAIPFEMNPADMRLAYMRLVDIIAALRSELLRERKLRHRYEAKNNDLRLQLLEATNQHREFREQVSWRVGKRCISTYGAPSMCKLTLVIDCELCIANTMTCMMYLFMYVCMCTHG